MTSGDALAGRRIIVLGAAGEVGEGLVRQLHAYGAHVVAVSRSAVRLAHLTQLIDVNEGLGTISTMVGDVGEEAPAFQLRDALLSAHGTIHGVVASIGGWRQGAGVTDTPLEAWREVFDQSLTAHFLAARALLPVIADTEGASYTLINGGAAREAVPGAGAMSVSAAGQLMLAQVLASEHRDRSVRVNALLLNTPVRTRSRRSVHERWISADDVGTHAAYLASDLAAAVRGATMVLSDPDATQRLPPPFGLT